MRATLREPSALLLAAQLAGILLYPFMEGNEAGRAIYLNRCEPCHGSGSP